MEWAGILAYISGTVDQELLLRNEYLAAENRILKAQLRGRLRLTDAEMIPTTLLSSRAFSRRLGVWGRVEEARPWREWAAARFATLVTLHLQAFADHAAEFWLWGDADPERASKRAKINFKLRNTSRARKLLDRALVANERSIRKDR